MQRTGWEAEAGLDDALLVAEGRQLLEALVQAPGLALAGVEGVLLAVAAFRARLEALQVVHVLVVRRPRRHRGEERGRGQEDADRPVPRHRSLARSGLSVGRRPKGEMS